MDIPHAIMLFVALSAQAFGAYGFLRKRLTFKTYMYAFTLVPVWLFTLGMLPSLRISQSPTGMVITAAYIVAGSTLIAYLAVRFAEKKQRPK